MIFLKKTSIAYAILHQAWPLLLSQFAIAGFGIVDVLFINHLSVQQSAAVGVGMNIFNTISIAFIAALSILPPNISKLYASKNTTAMAHMMGQGVWLAVFLTLPIIILLCFPDPLIRISQLNTDTESIARQYLLGLAVVIPAVMLFRVFFAYASGILQPKLIMKSNFLGLIVKLPLTGLLVFGVGSWHGLGALGCSLSSACILWVQVGFAAWYLYHDHEYSGHALFVNWSLPHWQTQWRLLKSAIPVSMTIFVDTTSHTMIGLFIARLSDVVMAGHQIVANIIFMSYMIPVALANSACVQISHAMGAHHLLLAKETTWVAIKLATAIGAFVSTTLLLSNTLLVSLYTDNQPVQSVATSLLLMATAYHFFDTLVTTLLGILRAYDKTMMPALLMSMTLWVIGLGGGYYLAFDYQGGIGAIGFWTTLTIAEIWVVLLVGYYTWRVSRQAMRGIRPAWWMMVISPL